VTGLELRDLRLSRGLTQARLARELGVGRSAVASMERGWVAIVDHHTPAIERVRAMPARSDPRLLAHAEGQDARARQHTAEERTCVGCGRDFLGPVWRDTCGRRQCTWPRTGQRTTTPRRPSARLRAFLLAVMIERDRHARAIAEEHGYRPGSVQSMCWQYGIRHGSRVPAAHHSTNALERERRIADMYLDGLTLDEIGSTVGLTRERVRQILQPMGATGESRRAAKRVVDWHRQWTRDRHDARERVRDIGQSQREVEGRALREQRMRAGLTQCALADRLGTTQGTISAWERGKWRLTRRAHRWLRAQLKKQ